MMKPLSHCQEFYYTEGAVLVSDFAGLGSPL